MIDEGERSKRAGKRAGGQVSPGRFVLPMALGLILGTATFAGYLFWSQAKTQHTLEAAPGDPDMAKPSAGDCVIAEAAMTAIHASGTDARWRAVNGVKEISIQAASQTVNPSSVPGYSDEEIADLRTKAAADWRWCPGMGAFLQGLGWRPINPDGSVASLALGLPGVDKAGDEAKVYELFTVPDVDSGSLKVGGGPWLVTLNRAAGGAWRVTGTADLPRHH